LLTFKEYLTQNLEIYKSYFRYTYGKPVKGIADVRIKLEYPRFDWINRTRVKVSSEVELQSPVNA
jgi:hypothetical protein